LTGNFGFYRLPASRLINLRVSITMSVKSSQDRKEYIAKVAETIFFQKGFKESSLQDVAAKANISKAGIYHYFKTKEDILYYILMKNTDLGIQALVNCINENRSKNYSPKQSFRKLIEVYSENLTRNKKNRLLVLRERHQLTGKNRKALLEKEREIFQLLKKELKRIAEINKKYNENVISFLVISMMHWMGYWFSPNNELSLKEVIDQSTDIVFHGMLKK
jgi:AcrR family transcriptional regulator